MRAMARPGLAALLLAASSAAAYRAAPAPYRAPPLRRSPSPSCVAAAEVDGLASGAKVDWSFLDAAFVITCPEPDGSNPRLARAMAQLRSVGLADLAEVREFGTDDGDRVRGCYNSHIAVLTEAEARFKGRPADEALNVLVLEDNLSVSPRLAQGTLDSIARFLGGDATGASAALVHLAYIMYVPGLSVERLPAQEHIVRLDCNADSVLGTTAYIISRSGLDTLMAEHRRTGYVDAIPNMMARLFPASRYAAFPMPLHRAATVKSLVNGQLDALRAMLFQPAVYTKWEQLLVGSGQSTNLLFPALLVAVLVGAIAGAGEAAGSMQAAARGEDVSLLLPFLSTLVSGLCLCVLGYGLALAPKPETSEEKQAELRDKGV